MATTFTETTKPTARSDSVHLLSPSRRHKKRQSDPFLELDGQSANLVQLPGQRKPNQDDEDDSIWIRAIYTPVMMISFLLSLVVVDRQQRAWRLSQHGAPSSWFSHLSIWSWADPEPYQNHEDSTWGHGHSADGQNSPSGGVPNVLRPDNKQWHTHKKHRRMAKLALNDALEMRGTVLIVMALGAIIGLTSIVWMLRLLYRQMI